jgi:hypothetical protein
MSLHSKIYKEMNKMYQDSKCNLENLNRSLSDYKEKSTSVFPKAEELKSQEIRYSEVMALLKKQSENAPKQEQNPHNIPWYNLDKMSYREIQESLQRFFTDKSIQQPLPISQSIKNDIKTAEEIQAGVKNSHSITLPPSVVSSIDAALSAGKLKPDATYNLICSSIDTIKGNCFSWKNSENHADFYAVYARDPSRIVGGDVLVRLKSSPNGNLFEAYRMIDSQSSKYLGVESKFEAIKDRVEQYVICLHVRDKINETIELSNRKDSVIKEPATICYGINI